MDLHEGHELPPECDEAARETRTASVSTRVDLRASSPTFPSAITASYFVSRFFVRHVTFATHPTVVPAASLSLLARHRDRRRAPIINSHTLAAQYPIPPKPALSTRNFTCPRESTAIPVFHMPRACVGGVGIVVGRAANAVRGARAVRASCAHGAARSAAA